GHPKSIGMEALLDLKPDMILAGKGDMGISNDLEKKLRDADIKFKVFDQEYSVEGTKKLIRSVADFVGADEPEKLIDRIDEDLAKVNTFDHKPKVLFIYARGAGTMMVAGKDTQMQSIIELAGGQNAVSEFKDFKPLTAEALVEA